MTRELDGFKKGFNVWKFKDLRDYLKKSDINNRRKKIFLNFIDLRNTISSRSFSLSRSVTYNKIVLRRLPRDLTFTYLYFLT